MYLSGFPLVKAYYFLAIFLVLKMKIKKKKREFFLIKNLELRGDNCENSGELVTNDQLEEARISLLFLSLFLSELLL